MMTKTEELKNLLDEYAKGETDPEKVAKIAKMTGVVNEVEEEGKKKDDLALGLAKQLQESAKAFNDKRDKDLKEPEPPQPKELKPFDEFFDEWYKEEFKEKEK